MDIEPLAVPFQENTEAGLRSGKSLRGHRDGSRVHDRSAEVRAYLAEHPEIITER